MAGLVQQAVQWLNSVLPEGYVVEPAERPGAFAVRSADGSTSLHQWTPGSDEGVVEMMLNVLQDEVQTDTAEVWPPSASPSIPRVEASVGGLDIGYAVAQVWVLRHTLAAQA